MSDDAFRTDLDTIRKRARAHMGDGAVTEAYRADRARVIEVLNEVLATEIVCVLRYRNHYFMASGINAQPVAQEFLQHANEEQTHADWVAQRITQLGGVPNLDPEGLATRSHAEYATGRRLEEMIRGDLVAERVAIQTYSEIIRWLGNDDPTTRRLIEDILKMEEEHADDLVNLLGNLPKRPAAAGRVRRPPAGGTGKKSVPEPTSQAKKRRAATPPRGARPRRGGHA